MRPTYDELEKVSGIPGCAWGLWGPDDEVGTCSDLTQQHALRAAGLVERGAVFSLNWTLALPSPALFSRGPIEHVIQDDGFGMDEHYNRFFPQASSQWDALSHFAHPKYRFYGGRESHELKGEVAKAGVDNLARRGIVTRFVLADVAAWREHNGRPIDQEAGEPIPISEVEATLAAQDVSVEHGDVLLLRFGWVQWYEQLDQSGREDLAAGRERASDSEPAGGERDDWSFRATGLEAGEPAVRWLWDSGAVAVASDSPAFEVFPFDPVGTNLHSNLIALLGMPIGEMWALDELARDCRSDGRYTGLLTSAPLNMPGGVGSTANAVAVK